MIKYYSVVLFTFLIVSLTGFGQVDNSELKSLIQQFELLSQKQDSISKQIETLKLEGLKFRLMENGLPELNEGENLVCHSVFCLVYSEEDEVAKWVAHILSHDIVNGAVSRTNDFRPDSLVLTGSSVEADYFIKTKLEDGTYDYDGFGYDRGHLAPSADFRWSEIALSESYLYSNMTPQLPDFNREIWAGLEGFFRAYVYNNSDRDLFIVTGPILSDGLPKQTRSVNNVTIPERHFKIAVDFEENKGIAFVIPQEYDSNPIESFVVSIDSVESITGINFFSNLSDEDEQKIESQSDISLWRSGAQKNDATAIPKSELPKNSYNTLDASQFIEYPKEVSICGTIVSSHKSKNGHVFLNLDKNFPNQVFSATIWKSNVINFSYEPEVFLLNKKVCIKGVVKDYQGTPSIYPENEKKVQILD
jgi:endonuclease G